MGRRAGKFNRKPASDQGAGEQPTDAVSKSRPLWKDHSFWTNSVLAILTAALVTTSVLQWNVTRDALKTAERAWVTVELATINAEAVAVGQQPVANLKLHNSGSSPALDLCINVWCRVRERPSMGETFPYAELQSRFRQTDARQLLTVLGPGVTTQTPVPVDARLSDADVLDARNPNAKRQIVLYGFFRYRDIFGAEHEQTFCYRGFSNAPTMASCDAWNQLVR